MSRVQISDLYTLEKGPFYYLDQLTVPMPWEEGASSADLDMLYLLDRSGEKLAGPLLTKQMADGALSETVKGKIASVIWSKFGLYWSKLWDLATVEYNPIENYDMTETHTGTETGLKTPTDWKSTETQTPMDWEETETQTPTNWKTTETQTPTEWKETETQTPTDWKSTETQTPTDWKSTTEGLDTDNASTTTSGVFGFNSSEAVPANTQETSAKNKSETEQTGTFETETEQTGTYQTERERTGTFETETEQTGTFSTSTQRTGTYETETEQSGTFEEKMTYNTTLQRHGNIGVQTTSDMISKELELWKWNFFDTVMADIDSVIALSLY